jgi:hypothetical protein
LGAVGDKHSLKNFQVKILPMLLAILNNILKLAPPYYVKKNSHMKPIASGDPIGVPIYLIFPKTEQLMASATRPSRTF